MSESPASDFGSDLLFQFGEYLFHFSHAVGTCALNLKAVHYKLLKLMSMAPFKLFLLKRSNCNWLNYKVARIGAWPSHNHRKQNRRYYLTLSDVCFLYLFYNYYLYILRITMHHVLQTDTTLTRSHLVQVSFYWFCWQLGASTWRHNIIYYIWLRWLCWDSTQLFMIRLHSTYYLLTTIVWILSATDLSPFQFPTHPFLITIIVKWLVYTTPYGILLLHDEYFAFLFIWYFIVSPLIICQCTSCDLIMLVFNCE